VAVLAALASDGIIDPVVAEHAIIRHGIDTESPDPLTR
jgi:hypothetical protein